MTLNFEAISEQQGINFLLKNFNFSVALIDLFNKQYTTQLSQNVRIDFNFNFTVDINDFNLLKTKAENDLYNRNFKNFYREYVNSKNSNFDFEDFREYMVFFLIEEECSKTKLYFNQSKINKIFEKLFNVSYENPKESVETFNKRFLNNLYIKLFDNPLFYELGLVDNPEVVTLYNLPVVQSDKIELAKRKINANLDVYTRDFQKIFKFIKESSDFEEEINKLFLQLESYVDHLNTLIEKEKDVHKKYKYIQSLRADLIAIRNIYTELNKDFDATGLNKNRTIRMQMDIYEIYLFNYQEKLFDGLVADREVQEIIRRNQFFKKKIEQINAYVIKLIPILDDKERRLSALTEWDKIYNQFNITELDTKKSREIKEKDFNSKLPLIEDNSLKRIIFRSGKDYTDTDLDEIIIALSGAIEKKFNIQENKTIEEILALEKIKEEENIKLEKIRTLELEIKNKLIEYLSNQDYPGVYDIKIEMNSNTFSDIIFTPRNLNNIEIMIDRIIADYRNEILEYKIENIKNKLLDVYRDYFTNIEEKMVVEAKERREKWNETIV